MSNHQSLSLWWLNPACIAGLALLDTEVTGVKPGLRTLRLNLRYVASMGPVDYMARKLANWKMRGKLQFWRFKERIGLPIGPAALTAEEGFLLALRRSTAAPYHGDAILFRAGDASDYLDPQLGWGNLIRGRLDIQQVSGGHDTILREPNIGLLAGMLARLLEACTAVPRPGPIEKSTQLLGRFVEAVNMENS